LISPKGKNKKENLSLFQIKIELLLKCFKNSDIQKANKNSLMIYNGCSILVGANLGDLMGSFCEFASPNENNHKAIWSATNPIFGTAKGQLTDDSEMAISMALGIIESLSKYWLDHSQLSNFNFNFISYYYLFWFLTKPFDIGNTTYSALNVKDWKNHLEKDYSNDSLVSKMYKNSQNFNINSLSNGFLMRHTPLTVFLYYFFEMNEEKKDCINFKRCVEAKKYDELFLFLLNFTNKEINLIHSNPECFVAAVIYDFLIISMLTYKTKENYYNELDEILNFDPKFHIDLLIEFLETLLKSTNQDIKKRYIFKILDNLKNINDIDNFEEESKKSELLKVGENSIVYYMHAINLIFFIVKFLSEFNKIKEFGIYRNIINIICNKGGDTGTNCCIVGGVIGTIIGIKQIEDEYLKPHLMFNPIDDFNQIKREFIYAPRVLTFYGIKLYSILNSLNL
jgi:ADP-ribosylglycohydrolase